MCTVLLPPGDNPIAVNKYINMSVRKENSAPSRRILKKYDISVFLEISRKSVEKTQFSLKSPQE